MRIAVYPGSFDPITNGHSDIIQRAACYLCDHLVISVAVHSGKQPLFSIEERVELCQKLVATYPKDIAGKISVTSFDGLLINHVRAQKAKLVVRGLRAVSDFEYEFQMTAMNARIGKDIETVFLMAGESNQFISSSFVKEIFRLGGDISSFVHPIIIEKMQE